VFERSRLDKVLIVGSDGLWEKLSEGYFVTSAQKMYHKKASAEKICKDLVQAACRRWEKECFFYRDDISSIVVILDHEQN